MVGKKDRARKGISKSLVLERDNLQNRSDVVLVVGSKGAIISEKEREMGA